MTQILREIKADKVKVSKYAIFTYWEALNFAIYEFWHVLEAEMYQINKIQGL